MYKIAFERGAAAIVAMEPYGLSWETNQFYLMSDSPQPSVSYRNGMMIHNYRGLAHEAGFTTDQEKLLRIDKHKEEDFHIYALTAVRP